MQSKINKIIKLFLKKSFFGFISSSVRFSKAERQEIRSLITTPKEEYITLFEEKFASLIGSGKVISFSSGRMAFFSILKALDIGSGDEVILTGFTCSVMVNAVLRRGATPVYADIDRYTLGTSPSSVLDKITDKTKLVVAQHTFGIPCEIDTIKQIATKHGLFLVEDCALTFLSSYKGIKLGDWGDASIFSTDHTKPVNTLVGGCIYTKNKELYDKIALINYKSDHLDVQHQEIIFNRYVYENILEHMNHKYFVLSNYLEWILNKSCFKKKYSPYLLQDSTADVSINSIYPYPAKMPSFIAYIGIRALEAYVKSINERKEISQKIIMIIGEKECIPGMIFNRDADIIPLRVPCILNYRKLNDFDFIDDWIWFKQPIVATQEPLSLYGYTKGMCPISESVGKSIMNFPILFKSSQKTQFLKQLNKLY